MNNGEQFFNTAAGGYSISRSLRFSSADSSFLSRTPASAGNRRTFTWSAWLKRSSLATADQYIFGAYGTKFEVLRFEPSTDRLQFLLNGGSAANLVTTQVFRDFSAWMHLTLSVDTTQGTASNRIKLYVNGSQVTTFSTATYPSQNYDSDYNNTVEHQLGALLSSGFYNGYLADCFLIDSQALDCTAFGEFSATTGVWVPKAYSGGSYGSQGWHLDFADNSAATAAALGKDTSGNSPANNWLPNNLSVATGLNSWSGSFDGSGDEILFGSASNWTFLSNGTSSWTVEGWFNTSSTGLRLMMDTANANGNNPGFTILFNDTANTIHSDIFPTSGGSNFRIISTAGAFAYNTWTHLAITFDHSSKLKKMYINGTLNATLNMTGFSFSSSAPNKALGVSWSGGGGIYAFLGGLSNVRIVKDSVVYTANFAPPGSNLTAIAGTQLLTLQSSSFVDNSANNYSATVNGNPQVSADSPYSGKNNDSLVDVPTNGSEVDTGLGGQVRGNYCTLNPLQKHSDASLANGNLDWSFSTASGNAFGMCIGTVGASSGKYYWEVTAVSGSSLGVGIFNPAASLVQYPHNDPAGVAYFGSNGVVYYYGGSTAYGNTFGAGDVIGVALDLDNGKVYFSKNGTWQNSGNPATQTNPARSGLSGVYAPAICPGASSAHSAVFNAGARPFAYTAPSGFKALCTANLPVVVTKANQFFDVALYTGNGGTQAITLPGGMSPDLVWIKSRSIGYWHRINDSVRGAQKFLYSNDTSAEGTSTANDRFTSFDATGFTLGIGGDPSADGLNQNTLPYAAWCWDAGNTTVTNTQGSITSQVRANASAGFSVQTWTASGSGTDSWGHGLGIAPEFVIVKRRNSAQDWYVWHKSLTSSQYLFLNSTSAISSYSNIWGASGPSSSLISFSASPGTHVSYAWAPVVGYSSMGSYTGNGSADGPFVYTGFRPRWLLIKSSSNTSDWILLDSSRSSFNVANDLLFPNNSSAEFGDDLYTLIDFTCNGFKVRSGPTYGVNQSGYTFVYAAFAESPFQYARAR